MSTYMKLQRLLFWTSCNLSGLPREISAKFIGCFFSNSVVHENKGSIWLKNSSRQYSKHLQFVDEFEKNESALDKRHNTISKPRITKPTRPVTRSSNDIKYQMSKFSSGKHLESPDPNSAATDIHVPAMKSSLLSSGKFSWKNQRNLKSYYNSSEELDEVKEIRNYNYGLSGIGKVQGLKLKNPPAVTGEILYGLHSVALALTADRRLFHKCYIHDNILQSDRPLIQQLKSLLKEKSVGYEACSKRVLTYLSQARPHQGVCLDVGPLNYETFDCETTFESMITEGGEEPNLFVVLDSVQDPVNLGAVIRLSYFLGVDQLFVVKKNSCPLTPVVSKCSAGAMEVCKVYAITNLFEFLEKFCQRGWDLLGTAVTATDHNRVVSLSNVSLQRNTILIIGNEGSGLTEAVKAQCHRLVTIPPGRTLHPLIDCLNVSVATGILLHHLCKMKPTSRNK